MNSPFGRSSQSDPDDDFIEGVEAFSADRDIEDSPEETEGVEDTEPLQAEGDSNSKAIRDSQEVNRIVAALVDDYHRQGQSLKSEDVLRLVTKRGIDAEGHLEVRRELQARGIVVDEPDDTEFEMDSDDTERTIVRDSMKSYLKEIGSYRLLNAQQEVELGRQIEAAQKAEELLRENPSHPRKQQIEQIINRGVLARDRLTTANLRLVVSIAKKYLGRSSDLELLDLVQEGSRGLMDAVERYDYRRGFKFSTYATWWIHQRIGRAIADLGRTIRLPVHIVEKLQKILRTRRALRLEHDGHEPTASEISEHVGLPASKVQFLLDISREPMRLDEPLSFEEGDTTTLADRVPSQSTANPEHIFMQTYLTELISESVEQLTPRQERVLRERFGLDDGRERTLEEIGLDLGLTRERIRQIESKALNRMRHPLRASRLSEFLDE